MRYDLFPSKNTLLDVHDKMLIPATHALKQVEKNGFQINQAVLNEMSLRYVDKIQFIEDQIRSYPEVIKLEERLGKELNMKSPDQVRELMYQELGLSTENVPKTTTGKPSTNKVAIANLKKDHAIVELMSQHRKYATLYKMFVKPMFGHIMPDGRVHPSLGFFTTTGRLFSERPNEQNIPRKIDAEEIGFEFDPALNIKNMFVPTNDDFELLQADQSQMELRILAEYCQDAALLGAFIRGLDIHLATGELLAGHPIDKSSPWRKRAKAINFGLIFGKGADALARELGITKEEAQQFISAYFSKMPGVKKFLEYVVTYCKEYKQVSSMFGRVRILRTIDSYDKYTRYEAERQAVNMPIQSSASDYTLAGLMNMVVMFNEFAAKYRFRSKIVATVHDSIVFDVFKKERDAVIDIVSTVMVNPQNELIYWNSTVPYVVDIETGTSWGDLAAITV